MFRFILFGQSYPPKFIEDLKVRNLTAKPAFSGLRRPAVHYTYLMRMAEYCGSKDTPVQNLLGRFYRYCARRYGMRYGITLPPKVAPGPGLFIVHAGSIVVNGHARIGRNCRIHAGVNIGETGAGVPRIGDNVYIGPGAKLFGDIEIGDDVQIGANAVVSRSVPSNCVVSGPHARVVSAVCHSEAALGASESLSAGGATEHTEIDPTFRETVMRVLAREIADLTPDKMAVPFDAAGLDSFALISLRSAIETELNQTIPDADWSRIGTLEHITQLNAQKRPQSGSDQEPLTAPSRAVPAMDAQAPNGTANRHYQIGMPQMAVSGLSEAWLFKEVGDVHWNMLAAFLGRKTSEICDDDGNRLYATFARVRIAVDGTLRDFRESQKMEINGKLSRFGANMFFSEQTLIAPDATAQIQAMSSFAMHKSGGDNTALTRGSPQIDDPNALPSLSEIPPFGMEYKSERGRETNGPAVFETTYDILAPHDINGVGLLYFASYPSIFDICVERHEDQGFLNSTSVQFRDISYIANARPDDALTVILHERTEEKGTIVHRGSIYRKRDQQRMAAIECHRQRVS